MKKINLILISCLALLLGLFSSCEKENLQQQASENAIESRTQIAPGVSFKDGRLVFEDAEVFEEFVHSIEALDVDSFLQTLSPYQYKSLYRKTGILIGGTEELDEPAFEAILNEYATVEIEGKVYSLNFRDRLVYMLPNTASKIDITYMGDTASDPSDPPSLPPSSSGIVVYTLDDLVLSDDKDDDDDADDGGTDDDDDGGSDDDAQALGFCNPDDSSDNNAERRSDPNILCQTASPECDFQGSVRAKYFRGGIWFRLYAEFGVISNCAVFTPYDMNIDADWNVCGPGGVDSFDDTVQGNLANSNTFSSLRLLYSGTRRLKTYSLCVDADFCTEDKVLNTGEACISSR